MIIYSSKIIQFVHEIKRTILQILSKEVGLRVGRDRFYDRAQRASYPIQVVIYNNKRMLGYFDSNFYELGFHECLMLCSKGQLEQIIRHEIAHYMVFIEQGPGVPHHGAEFRRFCHTMGWGEEVFRATTCLEDGETVSESQESSVLRKVQKLMALANSSNQHEAELAMIKSRELLLKHNLEYTVAEEKVFLRRIMKQKKENAKMRAIAKILETFFVSTVFRRAGDATYLEILGSSVNVEIAEYVSEVLQRDLDNLWSETMRQTSLRGSIAKNSFFLGLAKGYCNKIQALKRDSSHDEKNALLVIEQQLNDARAMAYQRLSSSRSSGSYCRYSSAIGEQVGQQLNINPGLKKSSNRLIGFFKK